MLEPPPRAPVAISKWLSKRTEQLRSAHKNRRIVISATFRWWSTPSLSRSGHLITLGVYHRLIDRHRAQATCNYLWEQFSRIFVKLVAGAEPWTQRSLRTVDDLIIPLRILLSVTVYTQLYIKMANRPIPIHAAFSQDLFTRTPGSITYQMRINMETFTSTEAHTISLNGNND